MIEINNCPSSLIAGFDTYSPKVTKMLFEGAKTNRIGTAPFFEFR